MATKRSILITGASSGIGWTAAETLHKRGWQVIATARKDDDLQRLSDLGVEALCMDYAEPDQIAATADAALKLTNGHVFALFNNGAYALPGAVEDIPTDALRRQFEVNFFGWHDLMCRLVPAMRAHGAGRLVQNSSVLGLCALAFRGPYSATKHALEAMADSMRIELRGSNIFISLIEPGPIETKFQERAMKEFLETIDQANSAHRDVYARRMDTLRDGSDRWKLPPSAVVDKLIHAIENPNPSPRYFVTTPTYLLDTAKRILPSRWRDALAARIADGEAK